MTLHTTIALHMYDAAALDYKEKQAKEAAFAKHSQDLSDAKALLNENEELDPAPINAALESAITQIAQERVAMSKIILVDYTKIEEGKADVRVECPLSELLPNTSDADTFTELFLRLRQNAIK